MTFLTPIPMIVALSLGVPALLAMYILKLRRRPVRVSSVLLWAEAAEDLEANVPFRRLRVSATFVLQLLALTLLAMALGRPILGDRPEPARRVAIVVDASASMSAADLADGRSRFAAALERAADVAREALRDGRGRVFIIQLDATPRLAGPPADTGAAAARVLEELSPTDQPGDVAAAFRLAESVLAPTAEGEADANTSRHVVLISDGGDTAGRALSLAGASFAFERVAPDAPDKPNNVGVVSLGVTRDLADPTTTLVLVRVLSTRNIATPVVLLLERTRVPGEPAEPVQRAAVTIPPASENGPGIASHTFSIQDPRAFLASVSFAHTSLANQSDLGSDDRAAVIVPAARRPAVLVVAPNVDGAASPDPFLIAILEALDLSTLRLAGPGTFDPGTLARLGYDLVVYDRVAPSVNPPVPSLHVGAPPAGIDAAPINAGTTRVLNWRRTHPTLRGVPLDTVLVAERLALPDRPPAAFDGLEVLADGTDGPLVIELTGGQVSRVVVGFDPMRSNWPVQFGYAVFVASAIDHLAPSGVVGGGRSFRTTEPAWALAPAAPGPRAERTLVAQDGTTRTIASRTSDATARVPTGVLPRAQTYWIEGATDAQGFVPVNLADERESSLAAPTEVRVSGRDITDRSSMGLAAAPRELWVWFAASALCVLCAEWLVFALSTRLSR